VTQHINISKSSLIKLPVLSSKDAEIDNLSEKRWSYSYVYHLREIRDVFLLLQQLSFISLRHFTEKCIAHIQPEKYEWTERKVLEQLNALKNFKLVDKRYKTVKSYFNDSTLGSELSQSDLFYFRKIFLSYYRFKQLQSWFLSAEGNVEKAIKRVNYRTLIKNSKPIYYFSRESRFTDTFIYEIKNNTDVYYLTKDSEDIMRFWDVFIKWGKQLGMIERFNLNDLGIYFIHNDKPINCVYFVNNEFRPMNLERFIKKHYEGKYINLSRLVYRLAVEHRYSVSLIKDYIIEYFLPKKDKFSLQRTSEAFIDKTEKYFTPQFNDYYASHLLIK